MSLIEEIFTDAIEIGLEIVSNLSAEQRRPMSADDLAVWAATIWNVGKSNLLEAVETARREAEEGAAQQIPLPLIGGC